MAERADDCCITVVCDGLHPDDIEELRRSLAKSRYDFNVDVARKVRTENYPELLVIGIDTKLVVRFSAKWFYGRTRHGGLKAVIKSIDDVLERSSHDRDLKAKVSFDSSGQELVTTETWLRPRMKKHSWTRDHKLALGILICSGVAAFAAVLVVPEFRRLSHLEKPEDAPQVQPEKQTSTPSGTESSATPARTSEPSKPAASKQKESGPTRKTTTTVTAQKPKSPSQATHTPGANSPAVGSITQGAGSALSINQQGGITAGVVNVDTSRRLSRSAIDAIKSFRDVCATLPLVNVTASNANQEAQRYAYDFVEALRGAGCRADLSLPIPGLTPDVTGVLIGVRDYSEFGPSAKALGAILSRAQVPFGFAPMKTDFFPDEKFVLVIGAKE